MNCPECGEEDLHREEVDVGVGVITGPFGCLNCGWSEDPYFDSTHGPCQAQKDNPGWIVSPIGGMFRKEQE